MINENSKFNPKQCYDFEGVYVMSNCENNKSDVNGSSDKTKRKVKSEPDLIKISKEEPEGGSSEPDSNTSRHKGESETPALEIRRDPSASKDANKPEGAKEETTAGNSAKSRTGKIPKLQIDEALSKLLRPLSTDQTEGLTESIKAIGCTDPIMVWNKLIVDGEARYKICNELEVAHPVKEIRFNSKSEAAKWKIERHRDRRQMNTFNRIEAAINLFATEFQELAKRKQVEGASKGGKANGEHEQQGADNQTGAESEPEHCHVNTDIAVIAESNPDYVNRVHKLLKEPTKNAKSIHELRLGTKTIGSLRGNQEKKNRRKVVRKNNPIPYKYKFETYQQLTRGVAKLTEDHIPAPAALFENAVKWLENNDPDVVNSQQLELYERCIRIGYIIGIKKEYTNDKRIEEYFKKRTDALKKETTKWLDERGQNNDDNDKVAQS